MFGGWPEDNDGVLRWAGAVHRLMMMVMMRRGWTDASPIGPLDVVVCCKEDGARMRMRCYITRTKIALGGEGDDEEVED
eukprot:6754715-Pyramimonas_sp.AAC.1